MDILKTLFRGYIEAQGQMMARPHGVIRLSLCSSGLNESPLAIRYDRIQPEKPACLFVRALKRP